jgi:hypothetical protein
VERVSLELFLHYKAIPGDASIRATEGSLALKLLISLVYLVVSIYVPDGNTFSQPCDHGIHSRLKLLARLLSPRDLNR